jgi:Immunity protein 50
MENIESLIAGSEKLTNIFGYWPSFYDAEVLELHFDRGDIQPAKGIYKFTWELTKKVDSKGYLVLRHHAVTSLRFCDVSDFQMQGFNHQNAMLALSISSQQRSEAPRHTSQSIWSQLSAWGPPSNVFR